MKYNVTFPRSAAGEDCHAKVVPNVRFVFSFYTLYLTSYFGRNPGLVSQYRFCIYLTLSRFSYRCPIPTLSVSVTGHSKLFFGEVSNFRSLKTLQYWRGDWHVFALLSDTASRHFTGQTESARISLNRSCGLWTMSDCDCLKWNRKPEWHSRSC